MIEPAAAVRFRMEMWAERILYVCVGASQWVRAVGDIIIRQEEYSCDTPVFGLDKIIRVSRLS
jgi:hypothetical protein